VNYKAVLASSIYPRVCLDEARTACEALCSVTIFRDDPQACEIEIKAITTEMTDEQVAREFLNYLLNLSVEHHLSLGKGRLGAEEV
jgi:hypothetical protein